MTGDIRDRRKLEREQRLQAALRENLRRRKQQARGRAAEAATQDEPQGEDKSGALEGEPPSPPK